MESPKKLDVLEHNLKTFPKFPKFDEQEHHFIHEVAMWKMKTEEELQNRKQRKMAQRANKQWQDGYCSAIDDFLGVQK